MLLPPPSTVQRRALVRAGFAPTNQKLRFIGKTLRDGVRPRRAHGRVALRSRRLRLLLRRKPADPLAVDPEHVGSIRASLKAEGWQATQSEGGHRMKLHGNAALSWSGRQRLAESGRRRGVDADGGGRKRFDVSARCARKWVRPLSAGGRARPARSLLGATAGRQPHPRSSAWRRSSPCAACALPPTRSPSYWQMALSTVSGILQSAGHGPARPASGSSQPRRYERSRPGELVHIDVKKLGRIEGGAGSESATAPPALQPRPSPTARAGDGRRSAGSTCTSPSTTTADSPTPRCCPTRRRPARSASCAAPSPSSAGYGISVERVLTDNGSAYRSTLHGLACRSLGIRHLRTRPYRPQTNGKAERFIRTLLAGWAYGAIYGSSTERTAALDGWLWHYNHRRRHSALGHQPPVVRINRTRPARYLQLARSLRAREDP